MFQREIYEYVLRKQGVVFVGTNPQQIIETCRYYNQERGANIEIPATHEIPGARRLVKYIDFPFSCPNQTIKISLDCRLELLLNANAFFQFGDFLKRWRDYKRGQLYKVWLGREKRPLFFFSGDIMLELETHNFEQYTPQIQKWLEERDKAISLLKRSRTFLFPAWG